MAEDELRRVLADLLDALEEESGYEDDQVKRSALRGEPFEESGYGNDNNRPYYDAIRRAISTIGWQKRLRSAH